MGRKSTRNLNLPTGMRARHRKSGTYYFFDTGRTPRQEIPLGRDYVLAIQKWSELAIADKPPGSSPTFRYTAERYFKDVVPEKGLRTQEDNVDEIKYLYMFFDDPPAPLDSIEPVNMRQYLDWRAKMVLENKIKFNATRKVKGRPLLEITGKEGHVRANREKALFSHIWNYARETGITNKANPCAGVKGFKEPGRDIYIDDIILDAVYDVAEQPLKDALDLAYLTAQRPADVRKISPQRDIKDGAIWVRQNKGGKKLRINIEGELEVALTRIMARNANSQILLTDMKGQPLTKDMLRGAFDRARILAQGKYPELADDIKKFQFRDLRAKAGTDTEEFGGMSAAQAQLGHTTPTMTAHYVRHRKGKLVPPTK